MQPVSAEHQRADGEEVKQWLTQQPAPTTPCVYLPEPGAALLAARLDALP